MGVYRFVDVPRAIDGPVAEVFQAFETSIRLGDGFETEFDDP